MPRKELSYATLVWKKVFGPLVFSSHGICTTVLLGYLCHSKPLGQIGI
ncbi:MAG: hypothetical protein GY710_11430 [Desulfobacteraceae bacterium]|nr:hypothetical protein [Desulfobacteraceae bacterium]